MSEGDRPRRGLQREAADDAQDDRTGSPGEHGRGLGRAGRSIAPGKRTRVQARYGMGAAASVQRQASPEAGDSGGASANAEMRQSIVRADDHCQPETEADRAGCFLRDDDRLEGRNRVRGGIVLAMNDYLLACSRNRRVIEAAIARDNAFANRIIGIALGGVLPMTSLAVPALIKRFEKSYPDQDHFFGALGERSLIEKTIAGTLDGLRDATASDARNSTLGFIEYLENQQSSIGGAMFRAVEKADDFTLLAYWIAFSEDYYDPRAYATWVDELVAQYRQWIEPLDHTDQAATVTENAGNMMAPPKQVTRRAAWIVGPGTTRRLAHIQHVTEQAPILHQAGRALLAAGVAMQGNVPGSARELMEWVLEGQDEVRFIAWMPDDLWSLAGDAPEIPVDRLSRGRQEAETDLNTEYIEAMAGKIGRGVVESRKHIRRRGR
jgi:hypothetical protein